MEVSVLTAAGTLVAFLTTLMDIVFLGSSLYLSEVLGCGMIFAGLAVITTYKDGSPPTSILNRDEHAEKLLTP